MNLLTPLITSWRRRRLYARCLAGPARAVVLRYHSVGEPAAVGEYLDPGLSLAPERFRAQLVFLHAHCRVVPLSALVERLARTDDQTLAVALTFDDGYRDNHDIAVPLLREYGMTASFYIATQPLGSQRGLWISELWRLTPRLPEGALDLPESAPRRVPQARDSAARTAWRRAITSWLAARSLRDREAALDQLAARAGIPRGDGLAETFVTADQLRSMHRQGMTIGAHTRSHPHLDLADAALHAEELQGSKRDLEEILGEPVTEFAYPNPGGSGKAGPIARSSVEAAGFKLAVTSQAAPLGPGTDRLLLPRIGVYAGRQERTLLEALRRA